MLMIPGRLSPLRGSGNEAHLDFLPQDLDVTGIVILILVFIGRQVLHVLGFGKRLQPRSDNVKNEDEYELPKLRLSMPFRVRKQDLDQYARAVDLADPENILSSPAQTCLLLAALSMPAMLLLLAHHKSPVLPLGAVNVRNKYEILRPEFCSEEALLDLQGSEVRSELIPEARKVKRGLEMDLSVEIMAFINDKPVVLFRQIFTMLQFTKFKGAPGVPPTVQAAADDESLWLHARSVPLKLLVQSTKAWAAICKDYNPIHISTLAAKAFGFPGKIAHGNYAVAAAVAQLEKENDLKHGGMDKAVSMEVQFRRPISLPASLRVEVSPQGGRTYHFRVIKNEKVCVSASLVNSSSS
jgi:acyl dehydratase